MSCASFTANALKSRGLCKILAAKLCHSDVMMITVASGDRIMSDITSRDLARHARLFELLRQQNAARSTIQRLRTQSKPNPSEHQRFKHMAEKSLSSARAEG